MKKIAVVFPALGDDRMEEEIMLERDI